MQQVRIPLFQKYDITPTTDCIYGVFGPDTVGQGFLTTSGSSTTVTPVTAGTLPYKGLTVGTEISVNRDGTRDVVYLTAIDSGFDSGTVDTAVNWQTGPQLGAGRAWHYRIFLGGQLDTDGWFNRRQFDDLVIQYAVPTFNATSLTLRVEGRIKGPQTSPITLLNDITVTGITPALNGEGFIRVPEGVDEVRFGALVNTDGGVNTLNAYALGTPRFR